jgi:hypothetical protein
MLQAKTWAASLDADKIANECSPVHIANVIKQAQQYIALLTAKKPAAPRKSKLMSEHQFLPVHYKVAARKGTTPEQLIARQMSAMKQQSSLPGLRTYPSGDVHLKSTHAYVHAFYALNHTTLYPSMAEYVDGLFQPLNKTPTTWPQGPEVETQTEA